MHCNGFRTEFEIAFENFHVAVQSHCWCCRNLLHYVKNGWTWRSKKSKNHVDLTLAENYTRHQKFPDGISTKGNKANFGRACKKFSVSNGQLMYKGNRPVFTDKQRRIDIIDDVHQGLGNNVKAVAMSSHLGRTSTYQKSIESILLVYYRQ